MDLSRIRLSRRAVIKGGLATAVTDWGYKSFGNQFHIATGAGWLSLYANDELNLHLNQRYFFGSPRLHFTTTKEILRFELKDARLAGSKLLADITCEIWAGAMGMQTRIELPGLGLEFTGALSDWLGAKGLVSESAQRLVHSHHPFSQIAFEPGPIRLRSTGVLHFERGARANLYNDSTVLRADEAEFHPWLHHPGEDENCAASKIVLHRGAQSWKHEAPKGRWEFDEQQTLFDHAAIWVREYPSGERHIVSELSRSRVRPHPLVHLLSGDQEEPAFASLRFRNLSYKVFSSNTHRLVAQLAEPVVVSGSAMAIRLHEPDDRPALIAERPPGQKDSGSIVTAGTLALPTFENVLFDKVPKWSVRIDCLSSDVPPLGNVDARLRMAQSGASLEGAIRLRIVRAVDGLDLLLCITNAFLTFEDMLIRQGHDDSRVSLMIVDLPPQVFLTPAVDDSHPDGGDNVTLPTCGPFSRLAAPSRLSFEFLTEKEPQREFTLKTFLRWADYRLHVAPQLIDGAKVPAGSPVSEFATQIVVPGGLTLSPDENHAFFASEDIHGDERSHTYQLWNARATLRPASGKYSSFGSDFPVIDELRPSLSALNARTLSDLNYGYNATQYQDILFHLQTNPAKAKYLRLSNRGAWLDISQKWPLDAQDTTSFHTRVGGQLEQLEQITYEGILVPTGHRVVVQQTSALQWCRDRNTGLITAAFVKRFKIIYQQPTVDYTTLRMQLAQKDTLLLPFNQITLCGKESSFLDTTEAKKFIDIAHPDSNYWAWVDQDRSPQPVPFLFPIDCTDVNGVVHHTKARMVVAIASLAYDTGYATSVLSAYNSPVGIDTSVNFLQSRVGYAVETKRGDTSFPTGNMQLQAKPVPDLAGAEPSQGLPWYPTMQGTSLMLEQVAAFGATPLPQTFAYSQLYKAEPFDVMSGSPSTNKAEIVLQIPAKSKPVQMQYKGQLGGGLALPSSGVQALARRNGAIFKNASDEVDDDLTKIAQGTLTISEIFGDISAACDLLGAVRLSDILQDVSDSTAQAAAIPLLALRQIHTIENEVISKVRDSLSTLLSYEQTIVSTAQQYVAQGEALRAELIKTIGLAASLGRVLLAERQPTDIAALEGKLYFLKAGGGAAQDLIASLEGKLKLSATQRVLQANTLPLQATPPVLPTLFQYRDYACYQLATDVSVAADGFISTFEQTLTDLQDEAQQTLEKALTTAISSATNFTSFFVFQLADALAELSSTLSGTINTETLVDLADNIETVRKYIALVPQWKTQWQALKAQLVGGIPAAVDPASGDSIVGALTGAVSQINDFLDGACSANSPAGCGLLRDILKQAINSDIPAQFKNPAIVQAVQSAVNTATAMFQQFETGFDAALGPMIAAIDHIEGDLDDIRALLQIPRQVVASFDYETVLNSTSLFIAQRDGKQAHLSLHASVTMNLDGTPPTFDVSVEVDSFQLLLIPQAPFVLVSVDHVRFTSHNGQKPTVSCPIGIGDIQFIGPLDFVAGLAEQLGLGDDLIAALNPSGVELGIAIPLPDIEVGAFDLVGLNVSTAVKLSFTGDPLRLVFGFATPNQHFIMTYLFLGGGGFINLEFTPTDMSQMSVAAALEAGAMLALDFGVASGDVHAFAGFYMQISQGLFLLSGYYRCGGELDVLGLISASVEFSMALAYEDRNGTAWLSGECDLVIDVHVFLFSASVSLHMQHDFCGNSGS